MATPVVAGAVALMKNHQSDLSIEQIFAKLIQLNKLSMFQAGVLDIPNSILNEPLPDLYFVANVIDDSDSGGNNNGRVDAGEQVNMFVRVKNAGGLASGVYAKLRFREFEDQTTANIIKSTSQIGPISAYGQLLSSDSIIVDFNENLAHGRFVSFELLIWQEGLADTTIANLDIKVEKGIEIKGVYDDLHLTGDAYYLVTEPAVFNNLTIDPGVTLRFGNNMYIMIAESLTAIGKPDSMITFKGADDAFYRGIRMTVNTDSHFEYCIFEDGMPANDFWLLERPKKIYHSIFRNSLFGTRLFFPVRGGDYKYNVVTQNGYDAYDGGLITFWDIGDQPLNFKYNLIKANEEPLKGFVFMNTEYPVCMDSLINNTFIGKYAVATNSWNGWPLGVYKMNENYWGTTNINDIRSNILDFFEDPTLPVLEPDTILQLPPEECHGFVWKIELNGVNPQDGILDPFGGGLLRFDIHFNRPMDTSFTPFVTFGVRFPFTQNAVTENTSWSADSTVWTGYHNISLNTGDGINTIRVAHARDTDRFEIPIERDRFSFVIQAAGSQSIDFYATPGIGKVSLQWPKHEDEEVLGYNLYRYNLLDSLSTSDTLLINNALLTDTTFIDFSVIPDTSYFYMFTVTKTDLSESDYSKVVFAKPFSTANGDANGDMATNILDITTIVSFILGQNPQPFLFEAADLNADEIINLLDIILTANIILDNNKKSAIQSEPAYIGLQDNQVILKSDGTLSGLQFQLIGKRITDLTFHNLPKGFEFVKHVNGDTLSGLLFNFGNTTLSEGEIKLFEVSNSSGNLKWGNTFGGNHGGVYVPVYVVNNSQIVDGNFSFNVFPNPADNLITLDVGLPTLAQTQIIISDVFGRELYRYEPIHAEAGHFQLSINKNQLNINSGVVIFTIDVQPLNDSTIPFKKSVKLIIM